MTEFFNPDSAWQPKDHPDEDVLELLRDIKTFLTACDGKMPTTVEDEVVAALSERVDAAIAMGGDEWLLIETAPKDGTAFLGWSKSRGQNVCVIPSHWAHFKAVEAVCSGGSGKTFRPTHWRPLPAAPQLKGGSDATQPPVVNKWGSSL